MRPTLAFLVLLAALPACAPEGNAAQPSADTQTAAREAGGVADPAAFIRSVYTGEAEVAERDAENAVFTPRLRALFADAEHDAGGEVGRLEFNFWTNAQDDDVKSADVETRTVEGRDDRRIVAASFVNIGRPSTIHYYFERIDGRWYLDDVRNEGGKGADDWPWTLSLLLKYGDM